MKTPQVSAAWPALSGVLQARLPRPWVQPECTPGDGVRRGCGAWAGRGLLRDSRESLGGRLARREQAPGVVLQRYATQLAAQHAASTPCARW